MTWQKKEHCVNQTDRQTYPGAAHQRSPATHTQDEPPSALPTHSWSSLPPHTDTGATLTQPAERRRDEDTVIAGLRQSKSPPWIFRADLSKPPPAPPLPGAKMSCRKRCKREIFKFAQYLFRLVTGTLNTGKAPGGLWVAGFSPPVAILLNLQRFWL